MSIHVQVAAARQRFRDAGIPGTESDLDARLLAQHVLGWTTERFFTDAHAQEPEGFSPRYETLVARRATREPLAYIVGVREFWGLALEVTPDVLIPRPATELITSDVESIGLTAKLTVPVNGHWPVPASGLSPGCSRPVVRL